MMSEEKERQDERKMLFVSCTAHSSKTILSLEIKESESRERLTKELTKIKL